MHIAVSSSDPSVIELRLNALESAFPLIVKLEADSIYYPLSTVSCRKPGFYCISQTFTGQVEIPVENQFKRFVIYMAPKSNVPSRAGRTFIKRGCPAFGVSENQRSRSQEHHEAIANIIYS